MSDVFILYTVVCYLFCLGVISKGWDKKKINEKVGCLIFLIAAPVFIPIRLGYISNKIDC
jgi:hypothetical protein